MKWQMAGQSPDVPSASRACRFTVALLALTAAMFGTAGGCAAPIQADLMGNAFLAARDNAGISKG